MLSLGSRCKEGEVNQGHSCNGILIRWVLTHGASWRHDNGGVDETKTITPIKTDKTTGNKIRKRMEGENINKKIKVRMNNEHVAGLDSKERGRDEVFSQTSVYKSSFSVMKKSIQSILALEPSSGGIRHYR